MPGRFCVPGTLFVAHRIFRIPAAKVLDCRVDFSSLHEASFIMAADSAEAEADDTVKALAIAQAKMEETAANEKSLLASAQQRAQVLLEEYVNNILGKENGLPRQCAHWLTMTDLEGRHHGRAVNDRPYSICLNGRADCPRCIPYCLGLAANGRPYERSKPGRSARKRQPAGICFFRFPIP